MVGSQSFESFTHYVCNVEHQKGVSVYCVLVKSWVIARIQLHPYPFLLTFTLWNRGTNLT